MDKFGGLEGNAQTLRLLTETIWHGQSAGTRIGMNPTRALLDGVLKYKRTRSSVSSANHFIYDEQRTYVDFAHPVAALNVFTSKSIECQIMDWADDIAYSVGDLVDGVHARFITPERLTKWQSEKRIDSTVDELIKSLTDGTIARFAAHKIGHFIEGCRLTRANYRECSVPDTNRYLYKLTILPDVRARQECLKRLSSDLVFSSPAIQQLEYKAQRMLEQLFSILYENYVCAHHVGNIC